jgi:DNA-binding response OmpR family regulator
MKNKQILLVEDDRGIQGLISVIFSRRQIEVDVASDGGEALEKLRSRDYGALLLDLMLPRVNGFEVVRELKATKPEMLKRTIIVTAASDLTLRDFDHTQVLKLLRKPFSIGELVGWVDQCLENGNGDGRTRKRSTDRIDTIVAHYGATNDCSNESPN